MASGMIGSLGAAAGGGMLGGFGLGDLVTSGQSS